MATKKTSRAKATPRAPRRKPVIPTDEELEARRRRVKELWGLPDRLVAQRLIEEGFFSQPVDARVAPDPVQFAESCRRTISNDRRAIREEWRLPKAQTAQDRSESVEEYIARLQTYVDQIAERLMRGNVKDTPYASLMDTMLRYEAAIAKARGTDEAPPSDDNAPGSGSSRPFLGVIVGLDNVSPDARKKIAQWMKSKDGEQSG